jgi:hypothetical protein
MYQREILPPGSIPVAKFHVNALFQAFLNYPLSWLRSDGAEQKNQAQSVESYTPILIFLSMRKSYIY